MIRGSKALLNDLGTEDCLSLVAMFRWTLSCLSGGEYRCKYAKIFGQVGHRCRVYRCAVDPVGEQRTAVVAGRRSVPNNSDNVSANHDTALPRKRQGRRSDH